MQDVSTALRDALDAVERETAGKTDEKTLLMAAKISALLIGYHRRWMDSGYQAEQIEHLWHLPIVNSATGRHMRRYTQAGRMDGIVTLDGKRYLIEHKTTSEDIEDPASPYWRRMAIDSQVSMYGLALWQNAEKVDGTVYDVIRKPTIRPKDLPKGSPKKTDSENRGTILEIANYGTYYGGVLPSATIDAVHKGYLIREDSWLYHHRFVDDILSRPTYYYQRRVVPRLDSDLADWAEELWDVSHEISRAERDGRHYKNSDACMTYGRPCDYLSLCSGYDTPDSDNWRRNDSVHHELGDGFSRSVITCSRIKCFQTCRRKHFWRYIEGLERNDEEQSEALWFGTLFHLGLEAWFHTFRKDVSHGDSHQQLAATGVVGSADSDEGTQPAVPSGDSWS